MAPGQLIRSFLDCVNVSSMDFFTLRLPVVIPRTYIFPKTHRRGEFSSDFINNAVIAGIYPMCYNKITNERSHIMENIGKRIRELRKKNDLTQEKLANYLNVSFQTVSKWENGINTPDLSFLVPLAKVLHTTTDILLGNAVLPEESDKLREQLEEAWNAERHGFQRGKEMIDAAQALVSAFPENPVYRCWMGYALRLRAFELRRNNSDGWNDLLEQALGHYKLVIEDCKEEYWHEEALENTASTLCMLNRRAEALGYAKQLKSEQRQERVLRMCLTGEERVRYIQEMRHNAMLKFLNELDNVTDNHLWAAEIIIDIIQKMISDGNYLFYHNYLHMAYFNCARHHAKARRYEEAMESLRNAWFHIQKHTEFQEVPGDYLFTAPEMDRVAARCFPRTFNFVRNFVKTLELHEELFAPLREREDFRKLEEEFRLIPDDPEE